MHSLSKLSLALALGLSLVACGGGGDPAAPETTAARPVAISAVSGPGDTERFWPVEPGNNWIYQITETGAGTSPEPFGFTVTVANSETVGEVTNVSLSRRSYHLTAPSQSTQTYFRDRGGLTFIGEGGAAPSTAGESIGTPSAYRELLFPMLTGRFVAFDAKGMDLGEDIDGDGKNETVDRLLTVTLEGFEAVTVPAGSFARTAKLHRHLVERVRLSLDGKVSERLVDARLWYAPNVGVVKGSLTFSGATLPYTMVQELRSYQVGGVAGGMDPLLNANLLLPPFSAPGGGVVTINPGSGSYYGAMITVGPFRDPGPAVGGSALTGSEPEGTESSPVSP